MKTQEKTLSLRGIGSKEPEAEAPRNFGGLETAAL
jgi:hypothetical protein